MTTAMGRTTSPRGILVLLLSLIMRLMMVMVMMMGMLLMVILMIPFVPLGTIDSLLTIQSMALKVLVRFFQSLFSTLHGLINKQSKTLRFPSVLVEPKRTILNLPKLLEEIKKFLGINLSTHVAHKYLPLRILRNRIGVRRGRRNRASRGQLTRCGTVTNFLLGIFQRLASIIPVLEKDESVTLRFARDFVGNGLAVLDLAVFPKHGS
ncbi:hypothetical protein V8G54_035535 [Vigna mungo]|uniref:Uncharacterized protein n=1 Tax=Vigna mungo TaxID=3915 RepID=A0AAQ3MFL5_VIGMU